MSGKVKTQEIDVIILCGGKGERLSSLVKDRPKPLVEINGRPFLDILIDYVANFGFRRFILCIGYMGNLIKEYYQRQKSPVEILFSEEKELLGTAGAIRNAEPLIKSDPFLVMNGDSVCKLNLEQFIDFHIAKKALFSMGLTKINDVEDYGRVILDKFGRIIEYNEKIKFKSKDNFINVGIYLFNKTILSEIPQHREYSLEYEVFPHIINKRFYGFVTQERFIDIGTPQRLKEATLILKSGLFKD